MDDLEFFRSQIDEVDRKLLELLLDRKNLVLKIGEYKANKTMEALQPARWEKVLKTRKSYAKEIGLDERFVENFWNQIHDYSLSLEK